MNKIIQVFFLGFVVLVGHSALAEITGTFESTSDINIKQEKEIIVISDTSTANRQRVVTLKNDGFVCEKKSRWHKCYKLNNISELPKELNISIPDLKIVFNPVIAIKSKYEGEHVTSIIADQNILVSGVLYKGVSYVINSRVNLVKVKVGIDSHSLNPMHFLFKDNQLSQVEVLRWHKSKQMWNQYIIQFLFKNID